MRSIDADLFCENVMSGLYIYLQADKVDIVQAINSENFCPECGAYMRGNKHD